MTDPDKVFAAGSRILRLMVSSEDTDAVKSKLKSCSLF